MFAREVTLLNQLGLKATEQRKITLHMLQNKRISQHFTAEELYLKLSDANKKIGIASIYRILSDFTEVGLVKRSCFISGKNYFELANESDWHLHLVNELTGEITEVRDSLLLQALSYLVEQKGYNISSQGATVYVSSL